MAIEIVPKQRTKQGIEISSVTILYYLSIVALFVIFSIFLGLNFIYKSSQKELIKIEDTLRSKETSETKALEQKVLVAKDKIDLFSGLFNSYKKGTSFFNFIKENCHKKVYFSKAAINLERSEFSTSGVAEGFGALGEQILILKNSELVREVRLSRVSLEKEGGVRFDLVVLFTPNVFK